MSEGEETTQSSKDENQQEIAYYAALVAAWVNTKIERDKSILALSAGGLGLLVTLLTTVGPHTCAALVLYVLATVAFTVALICVLRVFNRNAAYLEKAARDRAPRDPQLAALDLISYWSFVAGAVLLGVLGLIAGIDKVGSETGVNMSKSEKTKAPTGTGSATSKRSLEGIGEMRPMVQQQRPTETPAPAAPPTAAEPVATPQQGDQGAADSGKK